MGKLMTLTEFKRYCEERQPEKIIYNTENNVNIHSGNSLWFSVHFNSVLVSTAPLMEYVYLLSDNGQLHFNCVQSVSVDSHSAEWDCVKIHCRSNGHTKTYCLLMDY